MRLKNLILIISFIISATNLVSGQSFFSEYKTYLLNRDQSGYSRYLKEKRARKTTDALKELFRIVRNKQNVSMLSADTIYILTSFDVLLPSHSMLIWNRNYSCSLENSSSVEKVRGAKVGFQTNALQKLAELEPGLRKIVESIDTAGYNMYVKYHPMAPNKGIGFTAAIRLRDHWKFITSKTYATNVSIDL